MGRTFLSIGLAAILFMAGSVSAGELFRIDNLRDGELETIGFELTKGAEIDIEGVGLKLKMGSRFTVYAWILDHETREPVWVMEEAKASRYRGSRRLGFVEKTTFLEKGKYELYMYAGNVWNISYQGIGAKDLWDFFGDVIDNDDDWDGNDYLDDCYIQLSSSEISSGDLKEFAVTGDFPGAMVRFNRVEDNEYLRQGFTLDKAMNIRIYSLIEFPSGYKQPVDNGWIIDAVTRERVWEMDRWSTERAGRGRKNRKFDDEVRLEKGSYVLFFSTDDSHAYGSFNVSPPFDPLNWGITLLPGQDFKASAFHLYDVGDRGKPLVDLTRARDDEYNEQAFELSKPATFRVYACGEYGSSSREFVDYGWIANAAGQTVWEMEKGNTEHAGGGEKNRMFDGLVEFDAGKYIAYYVTDGSHAYRDWNTTRPYDPRSWGLAIYSGQDFDLASFSLISIEAADNDAPALVKMIRMRDREERSKRFSLNEATRIHILALGEVSGGTMYDYGWIENAKTGRTVWEMTRRNTIAAGGASKNRKFEGTIMLDAGDYEAFYVTDGSHSYNDWNASRPRDHRNWGITIRVADDSVAKR